MKKATIIDVAAAAKVSIKTVSRVLNGEANVATRTRERVMAAADALAYRPNPFARGLRSTRTMLVAHLYNNPNPDYVLEVNGGLYEACRAHGYYLLPEPIESEGASRLDELEAFLRASQVDGVVITPPLCDDAAFVGAARAAGVRVVLISPGALGQTVPAMFMDERRAAGVMTRHLIGLGHRRIGFIAGPASHGSAAKRRNGYRDALAAASIPYDPALDRTGDFSFRAGQRETQALLTLADPVTAIFAANDEMAAGALSALGMAGRRTPEDVSVAGFDDLRLSAILWPQITTIRQPARAMARRAGERLMTPPAPDETKAGGGDEEFGFELIVRASTEHAPLRTPRA